MRNIHLFQAPNKVSLNNHHAPCNVPLITFFHFVLFLLPKVKVTVMGFQCVTFSSQQDVEQKSSMFTNTDGIFYS